MTKELERHKNDLHAKIGDAGSGNVRYAAAMYFYNKGLCSKELLEVYRRCSKFDHEDPVELAKHEGITPIEFINLDTASVGVN